ncbi:Acetyltransferase (GNAT) family protein [Maribacter sedimenticola]|uniref:Acetyltransferase (GNAT) family protein n=1 Tax=Maribacter sedimenticola TaxID=228956 RepID=A0ABY1SFL2_9FLAO|nr:GNAT family N-acetyltransferase [Maribacter sedimenticola]SNR31918.1 Acetyltransferase (GNAT) family protein [Maribacter sedimenticola]
MGNLHFQPLTPSLYDDYIKVGTLAYNQHYKHLWPNGDTYTYIKNSFTAEVLYNEEKDKNTKLFLIVKHTLPIGILKLTNNKNFAHYKTTETLFLDKIYITQEYTCQGIGKAALQFVEAMAKTKSKKIIFLEAMQKGKALNFYLAQDFMIVGTTKVPFDIVIEEEKPMYVLSKEI